VRFARALPFSRQHTQLSTLTLTEESLAVGTHAIPPYYYEKGVSDVPAGLRDGLKLKISLSVLQTEDLLNVWRSKGI